MSKRIRDIKEEAHKRVSKRMREGITFYWCSKCECLYTELEAKLIGDTYYCPADGSQLEAEHIREPKPDELGQA